MKPTTTPLRAALGLIAVTLALATGATGSAAAPRFTVPDPYPIPQSNRGVPDLAALDISATGFMPHAAVYAQLCDGVPPASAQWNPHADCGPATAAVRADSQGSVDFKGSNPNWQILIWHGSTPTNRQFGEQNFNCLASRDNPNKITTAEGNLPIDPGVPAGGSRQGGDRANPGGIKGSAPCQVRLTTYLGAYQPGDLYLPIDLAASGGPSAALTSSGGTGPGAIAAIAVVVLLAGGSTSYLLRRRISRNARRQPAAYRPRSSPRERVSQKG